MPAAVFISAEVSDFVRTAVMRFVVSHYPSLVHSSPTGHPVLHIERGDPDESVELLSYRALELVRLPNIFMFWRHLAVGDMPTASVYTSEEELAEAVVREVAGVLSTYWASPGHIDMIGDVFVCHASEDKDAVAAPLAFALQSLGVPVWYDEFSIGWGDSLREKIDAGVARCRYGIVILSDSFFEKRWTRYELDGLAGREMSSGQKVILPIWHGVDHDRVAQFSPSLAERSALPSTLGVERIAASLIALLQADPLARNHPDAASPTTDDPVAVAQLSDPPRLLTPRLDVVDVLLDSVESSFAEGDHDRAMIVLGEARLLLETVVAAATERGVARRSPPPDFPVLPPGSLEGMFGGARAPSQFEQMREPDVLNMIAFSGSETQVLDIRLRELEGERRADVLDAVRVKLARSRSRKRHAPSGSLPAEPTPGAPDA